MRLIVTLITLLISSLLFSQNRTSPDEIATNDGSLTVQPITHGSVVLNWKDQNIFVDPYGGGERYEGLADPTLILITDIHGDHLNKNTP